MKISLARRPAPGTATRRPTRAASGALVLLATAALLASGLTPGLGTPAVADATGPSAGGAEPHVAARLTAAKKQAGVAGRGTKDKRYHVAPGWTLTSPQNDTRAAIANKLMVAINHTPPTSKIRVVSWNFDSHPFASALIRAHDRGVSVRLIMARTLADEQPSSGAYYQLKRGLATASNARRKPALRSWARTCDHSCRGKGGAMHAKYYVFSQAGQSKDVVMQSSANLTGAANSIQWNEMWTTVGQEKTYDTYMKVFSQASQDKPQQPMLAQDGTITNWFFPRPGRSNLAMDILNQTRCSGANGAGKQGRTVIRVGMDVFLDSYGVDVAKRLQYLYRHGCNVKIVYAQAGREARAIIDTMPNNHLVADTNYDGQFDIYLHTKLLVVSGVVGKDRGAHVIMDGSANFSQLSLQSDEQGMIIRDRAATRAYVTYIDKMYDTHLKGGKTKGQVATRMTTHRDGFMGPVDPYGLMED